MARKPLELGFQFRNRRFKDAEVGLRTFHQVLKKDWDGSAKVLSGEIRSFLDTVVGALAQRHSGAWPGGTGPKTLSKRTGNLINSIEKSVRIKGTTFGDLEGHISAAFPGIVHEFGATITPKKAKYLTVPLPAALDGRGVPYKKSARDWDHTFVAKSRKGNLIIFQRRGTQIVPLYVLKTSVKIPPRLGMQETLNIGIPHFVERAMDRIVKSVAAA